MATMMDYNELLKAIDHWNEYRIPLLKISQPDANNNFQGAMKFYFQDSGQKFATKCVNVTSSDTTKDVIDTLIKKFRTDMRMLSVPEYGLYEIHENGDERKLNLDERPLLVQLEWNEDDREGRFLLRRMDEKTQELQDEEPSLMRKLSKKEKKKQEKIKKQQQKGQEKADAAANKQQSKKKNGIAERFYTEVPTTSFTRSISNPDAVMRRRRAQKLEKRLQELSLEGGQKADVTLRIYGESINKNVAYKTLLLSTKCTASSVVKQILEKYGKDQEDPNDYCLVHLIVPLPAASANGSGGSGDDNHPVPDLNASTCLRECILDDDDCPLQINRNHDDPNSIATFHICRKPADYQRRRKKKPSKAQVQPNPLHPLVVQQLNQRLQINNNNHNNSNNNSEQYSNQNSSQNSSQTSGSLNHDTHQPPQPSFETVHSMPTLYSNNNGNMLSYQQHPTSMSTATLPPRFNNHAPNTVHPAINGTMPRQNYINHQNMMNVQQFPPMQAMQPNDNHQYRNAHIPEQQMVQHPQPPPIQRATLQILPALIRVEEDVEDIFLNQVITLIKPTEELKFRLTPTYVLYMVSRYRASTQFHPELEAQRRAELFMPFTKKIATMIRNTIEVHTRDHATLAFWLANSSDLNHFYKQDKHLSPFTLEAQAILRNSVIASFKHLLMSKQLELDTVLHNFFDENDDLDQVAPRTTIQPRSSSINHILNVLNDTMAIMRKNRVNAALTIQIFSHLFHHLNRWLFNRLIGVYDQQANGSMSNGGQPNFAIYCTRIWGMRLHRRLAMIQNWAEGQGLEQAADFHLARVIQVTVFLSRQYPPKINSQHLKEAIDSCDRLNPVQKRALLQRYRPDPELPILRAMIENFLYTMDYSYISTEEFPLEEDAELNIRFLIPEDGYSSEIVRDVPHKLVEYVGQLCAMNVRGRQLCLFTIQELSCGSWQVYFKDYQPDSPEIIDIELRKKNNSMGLSIIAASGIGQEHLGIYIKNVVKDGAAAMNRQLQAGDQLLEVDGNSLVNITQDEAAELMKRTGPVVKLKVAKQAAIYHNLSDVISSNPSQIIAAPPVPVPMPQNLIPPPSIPVQQFPIPERKPLPPTQPQQVVPMQANPIERQLHTEIQHDPRLLQYQSDRHLHHLHQERLNTMHQQQQQHEKVQQTIPERQVHFQPPPPQMLFEEQLSPNNHHVNNSVSPLKSPKKVSWVDTQPHQSLHTLIPPSPSLAPSPTAQGSSPPPEIPSPPTDHHIYREDEQNFIHDQYNNNNDNEINHHHNQHHHHDLLDITNGQQNRYEDNENTHPHPSANNNHHLSAGEHGKMQSGEPEIPVVHSSTNGQQLDTTTESLTLEDIDEVLSSKTHNNWLEDSAGVIGTQEVYNDPRQRIVKERERSNAEVHKEEEKLSFQEKLKMFNINAKK